jgi:hypothetical protein
MGDSWAPSRPVTVTGATLAAQPSASTPPVIVLSSAPSAPASVSAAKPVVKATAKKKSH